MRTLVTEGLTLQKPECFLQAISRCSNPSASFLGTSLYTREALVQTFGFPHLYQRSVD